MKARKTKKYLSMVLALVMAMMLTVPAMAEADSTPAIKNAVESVVENSTEDMEDPVTEAVREELAGDEDLAEDTEEDLADDMAEDTEEDLADDTAEDTEEDLADGLAEDTEEDLADDTADATEEDLADDMTGDAEEDLAETEDTEGALADDETEDGLAGEVAETMEVADMDVPLAAAASRTTDKIEDEDDPRKPLIEQGYGIDTEGYEAIYIKQSNDACVWVPEEDERSDSEIREEAMALDKSLAGRTIYVIRGEGTATLHNGETTVTVKDGILTVSTHKEDTTGIISHVTFVGKDAPGEDDLLEPEDGRVSTVFTLFKYVNEFGNPGEGFEFDIIPVSENGAEGRSVGTITSDGDGLASTELRVKPGSYIIRERVDEDLYMPVDDIHVTVDREGNVQFQEEMGEVVTNIEWSGLDISASVLEQYYKEYHSLVYKWYEYDTLVAGINPEQGNRALPDGIRGDYLGNGMTYLTIDRAALEELGEEGYTFTIAQSNKTGNAKKNGTRLWNTVTAGEKTFTLSIQDGQMKLESDLPHFGAAVYPAKATVNGPRDIKHDEATVYDLPAGGTFKFFIHWENTRYHLDEVIGCELDHKDLESHPYPGSVTMKVTGAEDEVVYEGAVGQVKKLVAGTYTVAILADGEELASETYTVGVGETASGDFGTLIVWGEDVVAECPYVPAYGTEHGIFPENPILKK